MSRRRRFGAAALASALVAGLLQAFGAAPAALAAPTPPASAKSGSDVLINGWGDSAGYHLAVAEGAGGYQWRELAVLRPGDIDDRSWTGYQCVSGDGRYAAVAVLPISAVNSTGARDHGAVAYSVGLADGTIHPIASGVSLKYHSPGCGAGDTAIFTANPGTQESRTNVLTADLSTGQVTSRQDVDGQITSMVPTPDGPVGVLGAALVRVPASGVPVRLAQVSGQAYDLRPTADGGVAFVAGTAGDATARVFVARAGRLTQVAAGAKARVDLFPGRGGRVTAVGVDTVTTAATARAGIRVLRAIKALPAGIGSVSLDGGLLLGRTVGAKTTPLAADDVSRAARSVGSDVSPLVVTAEGKAMTRPAATTGGTVSTKLPGLLGAAAVATTPQIPKCAVPRLAENRQALQPFPAQVEWAVQMAAQGLLKGSYQRPANYANMGLAAYGPSTDFNKHALSHPASDSWDSVPRSVMQAILAQESNWSQASWHSLPGIAGAPLIGNYYGVRDSITAIDYANADCGYGIGQVTSGMAASDTIYSANGKSKIAVDHQENIAAGLQILEDKWNQLYAAGVIPNDGSPRYLENWYFAVWAYNSGIQPDAAHGNTTNCTPGPACTSPDGTWGLGWSNNPMNPDYPPNRPNYLRTTYADAAHPSDWPYQERIMGWIGSPLKLRGTAAYAAPTYRGGNAWLQLPDPKLLCTIAANKCDPTLTTTSDPERKYCTLASYACWWHSSLTWVTDCVTNCATAPFTVGDGSAEPAGGTNPHPPVCSLDKSKVPDVGNGAAIVVDEAQTQPPLNREGCGAPNWSQGGTFTYQPGRNANQDPVGEIDTHQIGVGLGGHSLFTHTENGSNPDIINAGMWTPNLPKLQYYTVKLHIPATAATAPNVVYEIYPAPGLSPFKIRVNQRWGTDEWVTIGTFAMQNGGYVKLTNRSAALAGDDTKLSDYDVVFDAIAFVQRGGTPGKPIGGPPKVIDAPRGSNPSWVQCGCVRRTAGDPVDTSSGYYGETYIDLATPGRGMPLHFTRTYAAALADPNGPNGPAALNGPFGWGWTFSYNLSAVTNTTTGDVAINQEDGSQVPFLASSGTYTLAAPRFDAKLTKSGTTYTFTRRSREIFVFDAATGRLISETDLAGSKASTPYTTKLAYNGSGQLSTITDPAAHVYTLTWSGTHIAGLSDTAGRKVTYGYDAAGNLTDVYGVGTTRTPVLKDDDHTVFTYGANHLIATMRSAANFGSTLSPVPVTTNVYDAQERVRTQTDPLGKTTTFTYGPDTATGLVDGQTLVTDPGGHKTRFTYENGLLSAQTKGLGTADEGTWAYTYDPISLGVTSVTDPSGHLQTFSYDDRGRQITASDPSGFTTVTSYDDLGDPVAQIGPDGTRTSYRYDEAGHIAVAGGSNDGSQVFGVLTSQTVQGPTDESDTASASRTQNYYYDDAAHPLDRSRLVDPRGYTTAATFDAAGNVTATTDAENGKTLYGYDVPTGRLTSVVTPVGVAAGVTASCQPPAKGCTRYGYDAWGHQTSVTDPLKHVVATTYEADSRQHTLIDGNGHAQTMTYDPAGHLTDTTRADGTIVATRFNPDGTVASVIDGLGKSTSYSYDGQGRQTVRTDPLGRQTSIDYDAQGLLRTMTDPDRRTVTYAYDESDRMTSMTHSDGVTPNVTLRYDGSGRRTLMTDGTGTTTWTYDAFGEVASEAGPGGTMVAYGYDANGNTTTLDYPGAAGRRVTRSYDKADRLSSVKDWNSVTTSFGWDADGNWKTTTYPNGTAAALGYNDADELTSTKLTSGTTTLASLTYGRDDAGQVSGETPAGVPGTAQTFSYTDLEQLRTSTGSTFAYDKADRPTTLGTATQTFDDAGQLCWAATASVPAGPVCGNAPAGATTFRYDAEGERTGRTTGSAVATYGYNQNDRLVSLATAGVTAFYAYDGTGLRAAKTVNGVTTRFVYDASGNLLYDGTTSYLYGPGGLPIEQLATAGQWYFADQLGSTRALVDSDGKVAGTYGYSPYGVVTGHNGTASTPLQFTGQYTDAESGLVYLRARYYDPATAQFLTVDPAVKATRSLYGYVGGNPLNGSDPSGMCAWLCKVVVGAGVVAVVAGGIACAIAEPCGAIVVGGGLAFAGGEMLAGGLTVTISSTVVTATAGGAAVGAAAGGGYAYNQSHGNGSSGESSAADSTEQECAENADQPNAGSLKKLKDKQAKSVLDRYDTEPHEFKEEFVGKNDVAKFDLATGDDHQIYLISKNGKIQIPTGYYAR